MAIIPHPYLLETSAFPRLTVPVNATLADRLAGTYVPIQGVFVSTVMPFARRIATTAVLLFAASTVPNVASAADNSAIQKLADEVKLSRIPVEINVAVDLKNWSKARSFFANELRADFTSLAGGEPATIPADALISGWSDNLNGDKESMHLLGGTLATVNGDKATVVANGYAYNRKPGGPDEELWEVWGRYTYTMVRTSAGWKVDGMTFAKTFERGSNWVKMTPGE